MDEETIKKYIGKKVLIILKNNFKYTTILPSFTGKNFHFISMAGEEVDIECDFISLITELREVQ